MMKRAALWKALIRRRFSMLMNNYQRSAISIQPRNIGRRSFFLLLTACCLLLTGCGVRFDMQDQPRYKALKKSEFYSDGLASRHAPDGTVARGFLKENKAFYTGKVDNPDPNVQV